MNDSMLYFDFERRFNEKAAFQWFEENWTTSFLVCAVYAVVIFLGRRFMQERQKLDLRRPLMLWSLSLAVFSFIGAVRTGSYVLNALSTVGFKQTVCDLNFFSDPASKFWAFIFVLSKAPELGDTVFIVLRKQRLIFLHWYHHMTVLLYAFYTYKERPAGGCWFVVMNFAVHSFMYSYYALKAAGMNPPRPCAMLITAMQTLQMVLGLTVIGLVFLWRTDTFCQCSSGVLVWGSIMYFSYLVLFLSFFYQSYIRRGKADMDGENKVKVK